MDGRHMSIRLVADNGKILWLTATSWETMVQFAESYGWTREHRLLADEWDDSGEMNERFESIGVEYVPRTHAEAMADAVSAGLEDPTGKAMEQILSETSRQLRTHFPDLMLSSDYYAKPWSEFVGFVRAHGGFRIDWTD